MRKACVFIHLFLAVQLALPLSYYALRADRHDERFAWRMFSPERMTRCTPVFRVGEAGERVRLGAVFHEAWLTLASRGRLQVVAAMAEALCARNPGQPVRVELSCRSVDGQEEHHGGGWDVCASERQSVHLRSRNRGFAAHPCVAPRSLGHPQLPRRALVCLQLHDFARSGKPIGALGSL